MASFSQRAQTLLTAILVGLVVLFIFTFVVIGGLMGPGTVVAGIEYPFGKGPWGHIGSYCHSIPTFVADLQNEVALPSGSSNSKLKADLAALYRHAPDQNVKADWAAWMRGQVTKDQSAVDASAQLLSTWVSRSCNTLDISLPVHLNEFWNGFFGPSFGPLVNVKL